MPQYDALLLVSFGGPEGPDDVMPFLENVLRGKNVPRERMLEVARHYEHFGGVSPLNGQNRELLAAWRSELSVQGINLPVYWGNRNWHPLLSDTLREMRADGVRRALAVFTSAFSSYSGCRQYREDIQRAQEEVGEGAPAVDKVRVFFNHPGFVEAMAARLGEARATLPEGGGEPLVVYTAHSIPLAMAAGCAYEAQLREASRLVSELAEVRDWELVYQSRSGPPSQPWLAPDICDFLREAHARGRHSSVIVAPIGFLSDHMEVLFDLDTEARQICESLSWPMARAGTVGTHPRFVRGLCELVAERINDSADRPALGELPASHDICPADCCLSGRPPSRPQ